MLWREVGPLRAQVLKLRNETGQLTVFDPAKVYVKSIETLANDTWKWRVHLPKGVEYDLQTIVGTVRGRAPGMSKSEWSEKCGYNCGAPDLGAGEFTITVALRRESEDTGTWVVDTKFRNEATPHITRGGVCGTAGMDWLGDEQGSREVSGDAVADGQNEIDATNGLELMTVLRCQVTRNASGWSSQSPDRTRDNDGVAVWIVPREK
ncbi:MAG: hypothetical protein ACRCT8_16680 [Lacipirellulaceae bacterium]